MIRKDIVRSGTNERKVFGDDERLTDDDRVGELFFSEVLGDVALRLVLNGEQVTMRLSDSDGPDHHLSNVRRSDQEAVA